MVQFEHECSIEVKEVYTKSINKNLELTATRLIVKLQCPLLSFMYGIVYKLFTLVFYNYLGHTYYYISIIFAICVSIAYARIIIDKFRAKEAFPVHCRVHTCTCSAVRYLVVIQYYILGHGTPCDH